MLTQLDEVIPSFEEVGGVQESGRFESWLASGEGRAALADTLGNELVLGRVVKLDRGFPLVVTAHDVVRAEHAISLVKTADVRSAIGDWVALSLPPDHDKAIIEAVLPRHSEFSRWDGSSLGGKQVLASNIDRVLVAVPLAKKPLPQSTILRILKALVIAYDAGCEAAVVLTKDDRKKNPEDAELDRRYVERAVGPRVPVVLTSAVEGRGIEEVRALIGPDETGALLGESGAGKSTLMNALLGGDVMATQSVREKDDKGRHTTVSRCMLAIPGGGIIIDAPGLRSLPLMGHDHGLERAFPEISAVADACRFRDCTHGDEPECAVRELVMQGELDELRLESYRLVRAEMERMESNLDPAAKRTKRS